MLLFFLLKIFTLLHIGNEKKINAVFRTDPVPYPVFSDWIQIMYLQVGNVFFWSDPEGIGGSDPDPQLCSSKYVIYMSAPPTSCDLEDREAGRDTHYQQGALSFSYH